MSVLVDTNVIIDVLTDDRQWADWSVEQLEANAGSGLIINPVVYAELCFGSPSIDFVDDIVRRFALAYHEIPRQGLFRAAKAFAQYKVRKGSKSSVLPDFFIAAHAEAAGISLLTRDTKRLSAYFPNVKLICPQQPERDK